MTQTSRLLLLFSFAYGVFMVLPAFLGRPMPGVPLLQHGDILDLFTPVVILPLYYLLYRDADHRPLTLREGIVFVVVAALWAQGHGIHLAGNAIGHLLDERVTDVFRLTYFFDELLGHHIWHTAVLAMSVLIIVRAWKATESEERIQWVPVGIAAAIYGFTCFLNFVEGQTGYMAIPVLAVIALSILARRRHYFAAYPLLAFFAVAYMVTLLFCAGWALYWGGLPEFSEIGII